MTAEELYGELVAEQLRRPGVGFGRRFSGEALTVHGKIFAMLSGERLVVKVPAADASALVAAGRAVPFESGGRKMREWAALDLDEDLWRRLIEQAAGYVAAGVKKT